ncbi:Adenylate cyclase type 6, partial [Pseudolycoriella hygida]
MASSSSSHPMCRSFSSESQRKEWSKRLSLRGVHKNRDDFVSRKTGITRRSASLRQTRTAQISIDVPVPPPHISPPPVYTPAKKSNWEVIEHFNTSRGRSSVSSSLIAVGVTRFNIDGSCGSTVSGSACNSPMAARDVNPSFHGGCEDANSHNHHHPHSPTISFWYRLNKVIIRLCSSHQFKNLQVEMLYQRYFLRMNQSNTTHILSLLLALVISLAAIHIIFMPLDSSNFSYKIIHRNEAIEINATDTHLYNQSLPLDDQMNDTIIIPNDHPKHRNSTTTGNSYNTSHTGNKMSDNILISSHLNKDVHLYDKTISHAQKNIHRHERYGISNERKRIIKRHLKITTTVDKVTVDAYQDGKSNSFLDNAPTAVSNIVGESENITSDEALVQRSGFKSFMLLLVFGVCACIYGITLAVLSKPAMNEIFLVLISYVIIGTFFIIEICIFYSSNSRSSISSNGCTLIFVYLTYTMLPVRLREALIGGG